jgi:hypothetical protein
MDVLDLDKMSNLCERSKKAPALQRGDGAAADSPKGNQKKICRNEDPGYYDSRGEIRRSSR